MNIKPVHSILNNLHSISCKLTQISGNDDLAFDLQEKLMGLLILNKMFIFDDIGTIVKFEIEK